MGARGIQQHTNGPQGSVHYKSKGSFLTSASATTVSPTLAACPPRSDARSVAENVPFAVPPSSRQSSTINAKPFTLARLLNSTSVSDRIHSLASSSPYLLCPLQKSLRNPVCSSAKASRMARIRFTEFGDPSFARLYSDKFPELHVLNREFTRKYRLGSVLGAGGFGFVMDASDRMTGVVVAVKFLEYSKIPRSGWLCRDVFPSLMDGLKETHILSRVDHPGIVTLIETFTDNLYIYIVSAALLLVSV